VAAVRPLERAADDPACERVQWVWRRDLCGDLDEVVGVELVRRLRERHEPGRRAALAQEQHRASEDGEHEDQDRAALEDPASGVWHLEGYAPCWNSESVNSVPSLSPQTRRRPTFTALLLEDVADQSDEVVAPNSGLRQSYVSACPRTNNHPLTGPHSTLCGTGPWHVRDVRWVAASALGEVRPEKVGKSSDVGRIAQHHRGVDAAVDACSDLEPARRKVRPVELPPVDGPPERRASEE
jgi:hypothetical protein